jgi:hypothetical protein
MIYTVAAFLDNNLKGKTHVLKTFLCRLYVTNVVTFQDGHLSVINYKMFNEDRNFLFVMTTLLCDHRGNSIGISPPVDVFCFCVIGTLLLITVKM